MKNIIFTLAFISTSTLYAGTCQIVASSKEAQKFNFVEGYREKHGRVTLEECIGRAEDLVGQSVRMKSLIRDDVRIITELYVEFNDRKLSSSAKLSLKH